MKKVVFASAGNLADDGKLTEEIKLAYANLLGQLSKRKICHEAVRRQIDHIVTEGRKSEVLLWLFREGVLIGTAQASLVYTPYPRAYVNYVIIDSEWRRQGWGRRLMSELIRRIAAKWPEVGEIELTSNSALGTRGFYKGLGFVFRDTAVYHRQI